MSGIAINLINNIADAVYAVIDQFIEPGGLTKRGNELPPIDTIPVGVHSVGRHGLLCWQGAADRPIGAIFHSSAMPNGVSVYTVALSGRRLTRAVGLAAFSSAYSSSPPQRSRLRAALVTACAKHDSRTPSALVGPPWLSCQPPCILHSRVCFAVARLGASPLPARLTTAHSCRARPCLCAAKGVAQVCADRKEVTPAAPPNICCSRPPSRCDFPSQRVPSAGGGLHRRSHRAAAERHRWAALIANKECQKLVRVGGLFSFLMR
jgi:hypothetical protein